MGSRNRSSLATCPVCQGEGLVKVTGAEDMICARCNGAGSIEALSPRRLYTQKFRHPTQEEIDILKLKTSLMSKIALNQYPEIDTLFEKLDLLQQVVEQRACRSFRVAVIQAFGFFFLGIIVAIIVSEFHLLQ